MTGVVLGGPVAPSTDPAKHHTRRFGALLAVLALFTQPAFASWGLLMLPTEGTFSFDIQP